MPTTDLATGFSSVPKLVYDGNINPANITALTTSDQTFTIRGLTQDMLILLAMPSLEAQITFSNAHVSAKNTLKIRFLNAGGPDVDPADQRIILYAL